MHNHIVFTILLQISAPVQVQRPAYSGPSDFLILGLVVMGLCGIFNLTSLLFGIPGVIFAAMVCLHLYTETNNKFAFI